MMTNVSADRAIGGVYSGRLTVIPLSSASSSAEELTRKASVPSVNASGINVNGKLTLYTKGKNSTTDDAVPPGPSE